MTRKDLLNEKVISDIYELLHQVEQGRASLQELSDIFGLSHNKAESNYRQVERIKFRAQKYGIKLELDPNTLTLITEHNAKLKFLDRVLPELQRVNRTNEIFGFYAEKVSPVLNAIPYAIDEEIE